MQFYFLRQVRRACNSRLHPPNPFAAPAYPCYAVCNAHGVGPSVRRRTSVIFLLLLTFVVVTVQRAVGQTTGPQVISGRIVDADGAPVERAEVTLSDLEMGAIRAGDVTSESGDYRLIAPDSGRYRVHVSHLNYRSVDTTIVAVVAAGQALDLVMFGRLIPHDEVVVTESRAIVGRSPIPASNISRREIELSPDVKDLPILLASTPSISQYSENGNGLGYTYLRMRGFDQKRIAVSINGIPQNDPESFDVFWINFFDLQGSMQDVQVQRGAGSSLYGSTGIGGAINIVAQPYSSASFVEVDAGLGSYATDRLTVRSSTGMLRGGWTLYGRLSRVTSDGYRDWSWTDYIRYFVGARRSGRRSVLTIQSYGGRQKDGLAYIGIPKGANDDRVVDDFGTEIDRRFNISSFTGDLERFNQPHFEVHHQLQVRKDLMLDQSLFLIQGNGFFDFDGTFRSADYLRLPDGVVPDSARSLPLYESLPGVPVLYRASLNQWQAGWMPRLNWTARDARSTVGAEVRLHRSTRWGRIQESDVLPAELVGDSDYRSYQVSGEKLVATAFARTERRVRDRWTGLVESSFRFARYRVFNEDFFGTSFAKPYVFANVRLGVTRAIDEHTSIFASVSAASREPRLKTLYDGEEAGAGAVPQFEMNRDGSYDTSRPFVQPEKVIDLEVGANLSVDRARLGATAFLMRFSDEIVPSGGLDQFGVPRTGNADRTRHAGIEVEGEIRIDRSLDLFGAATLSRNRFVRFSEFVFGNGGVEELSRNGNPIAGFPDLMANAGVRVSTGPLNLSLSGRFVGRQVVDNAGPATDKSNIVPSHFLAAASLRFSAGGALDGLEVSLDLNNVLNAKVLEFGNAGFGEAQFFPAATRNVFVGARYRLDSRR